MERQAYPTDVSDDEWAFVVPYLTLMTEEAPQRDHSLREVFNGLRWLVRAGAAWRLRPHDVPPWHTGYQQSQRWLKAGVFDAMVDDLRALLRLLHGRAEQPSAAIFDSRTLQSPPESGPRAGDDGAKRRKGAKMHMAVDTLGYLFALHVTPAHVQDRSRVSQLAADVQVVTGDAVEIAYGDPGSTGEQAAHDAEAHRMHLEVVKLPEAKNGFVLLPKRWVVERSFAWTGRFRRLARDYERLAHTLAGLHVVAFAILMLKRFVECIV